MNDPETTLTEPLPADLEPGVHAFRSVSATGELLDELAAAGWATSFVDLAGASDKAAIMDAFAAGLRLPSWFGRNWDALDEALRDLSDWAAGARGRVLVVRGVDHPGTGSARDRAMVRDILETSVTRWATTLTPLVVLLDRPTTTRAS